MAKQKKTGRDVVPGFAAKVRERRNALGYSLAEVASAAGTSVSALSGIETEVRAPSLRVALAICRALGAKIGEMVQEE
jgi:transcriptional regulator with XRE-family HTH domain